MRQLSSETLHRVRVRLALRLEAFGEVAQGEHLAGGAGEVADQLVRQLGERLLDESVALWVVGVQFERVEEAPGTLRDDPLGERVPGFSFEAVQRPPPVARTLPSRAVGPRIFLRPVLPYRTSLTLEVELEAEHD